MAGAEPAEAVLRRADLAQELVAAGIIRDERIAAAVRIVRRHLFVPHVPLDVAYADDVVPMKRNDAGVVISSVSQPSIVALMLDQAAVRPGDRVLEVGSGGYNAALLRELTGPAGSVTTVDIDPEVTARARAYLDEAGYDDVRVVLADGAIGAPAEAPYDRIVVTVTAWDLAPAWVDQLRPDGRIVVPLRLRGQTRSIAFDRVGDHLESRSVTFCGFVCMQGAGADYERLVPIGSGDACLCYDEDQATDGRPLDDVLELPPQRLWSGALVDREEPLLDLQLWMACTLPGYGVLHSETQLAPATKGGVAAVVTRDGLAYLTHRPVKRSASRVELGIVAHGRDAHDALEQVRNWSVHHRAGPGPMFRVDPLGAALPPGFHIARRHSQLTISWAESLPASAGC